MLAYAAHRQLEVRAYPSLNAPVVDRRERGERMRGHAPVHFWIELAHGAGWVRYEPDAVQVLGRGPLSAEEAASPAGFARWVRLPPDCDLESASAGMAKAGGFFAVRFARIKPEDMEPPGVKMVDTSNGSRWVVREIKEADALAEAQKAQGLVGNAVGKI